MAYAEAKGAEAINLAGICCTANEMLMRHGIPVAGNFLQQELAIITGAVEVMVVDVQCIMASAAGEWPPAYHTKIITTSPTRARDRRRARGVRRARAAWTSAKTIVKRRLTTSRTAAARSRTPSRRPRSPLVAGFSHEYINYMLGGRFRGAPTGRSTTAIIAGRIRGLAGSSAATTPEWRDDRITVEVVGELMKRNASWSSDRLRGPRGAARRAY